MQEALFARKKNVNKQQIKESNIEGEKILLSEFAQKQGTKSGLLREFDSL